MNYMRTYVVFYGIVLLLLFVFSILAISGTLSPIVSTGFIAFLAMSLVAIRSGQKEYKKRSKGE